MFVTRHNSVVERGLLERLWDLYELAYRKTAEESASREMLFRTEFDAAIADSSNRLWVLWADDEPVAMVLIATDIGVHPLSQPAVLRTPLHRPHAARGGALHPLRGRAPTLRSQGRADPHGPRCAGNRSRRSVLLVFDSPEINQPRDEGGVALMMERLANMVVNGAPLLPLDVSRYFCIDFAATSAYVEELRNRSRRAPSDRLVCRHAGSASWRESLPVRYRMGK